MRARKFTEYECGYMWHTEDANGPHVCRKDHKHLDDITDDDHECCCGATNWPCLVDKSPHSLYAKTKTPRERRTNG